MMAGALVILPLGLAPLYLPPPEAQVRGDSLRVAINARREVYLYDEEAYRYPSCEWRSKMFVHAWTVSQGCAFVCAPILTSMYRAGTCIWT